MDETIHKAFESSRALGSRLATDVEKLAVAMQRNKADIERNQEVIKKEHHGALEVSEKKIKGASARTRGSAPASAAMPTAAY